MYYQVNRGSNGALTHMVNMNVYWRSIPCIFRKLTINIERANITENDITVFITNNKNKTAYNMQNYIMCSFHNVLRENSMNNEECNVDTYKFNLPADTKIMVYNTPDNNFTTMEFLCSDRRYLLSDLLGFISTMPFDLHTAYINTLNNGKVHNILHLQKNGAQLTNMETIYLQNVFEYEGKNRDVSPLL